MEEQPKETTSQPAVDEQSDVEKNKIYAVLAYIVFFIPLLAAKDSKFAMYHANQGLVLFLLALGVNAVGTILPVIGWFLVLPLGNLAVLALAIIGIINTVNGETKPLPLIGGVSIIKV